MDPELLSAFLASPCALETAEGCRQVTIKDKIKLIVQPHAQKLAAKLQADSASGTIGTDDEQVRNSAPDEAVTPGTGGNQSETQENAQVEVETDGNSDEPEEDWRRVFRLAMPKGTIISSHYRQKHWKKGASLFSEKHPDIGNTDYYGYACKFNQIDQRFTLVERRLRRPPVPPEKLYGHLRDLQNEAWALESTSIGRAHADKNEWEKATKAFKHALEIQPFCVPALIELANALIVGKNPVDALKHLERALKIKPTDDSAFRLMNKALSLMDPRQANEYERSDVYQVILSVRAQRAGGTPHTLSSSGRTLTVPPADATPVPENEQGVSRKRRFSHSRTRSLERREQRRISRTGSRDDYHDEYRGRDRYRERDRAEGGRDYYDADRKDHRYRTERDEYNSAERDDRYRRREQDRGYDSYVTDDAREEMNRDRHQSGSRYDSYTASDEFRGGEHQRHDRDRQRHGGRYRDHRDRDRYYGHHREEVDTDRRDDRRQSRSDQSREKRLDSYVPDERQ